MVEADEINTNIAVKSSEILGTKLLSSLEQYENAVSSVQFLDHHFQCRASISSVKDRQHSISERIHVINLNLISVHKYA